MNRLTLEKCGELLIKNNDGEYRSPCFGCESINKCNPEKMACGFFMALKKLKDYEDLEEQKKLIKLPCAVGDMVYVVLPRDSHLTVAQINKIEVKPTVYGKMCCFIEPVSHRGHLYRYFEGDFGKTVFLTKEAAEAALKKMSE